MSRRKSTFGLRCWQAAGMAVVVLGAIWAIGYASTLIAAAWDRR